MTNEEIDFENDTRKHQQLVAKYISIVITMLLERAAIHDASKLESPEREVYTKVVPKLKTLTYGSVEYKETTKELGEALKHHHAMNPHHPEHSKARGIITDDLMAEMNLIDIIEMVCDWLAAIERGPNGSITKSVAIGEEKYQLTCQLACILQSTMNDISRWAKREKEND